MISGGLITSTPTLNLNVSLLLYDGDVYSLSKTTGLVCMDKGIYCGISFLTSVSYFTDSISLKFDNSWL